ncbi:hypothetical protein D9615_004183 [Tricholomella constricta]|uniref:Protein kinase domain-containing protein n=1 Tax=Tricholomella constricta TaxID=117010 RepID=A0A8H5M5W1_9AGAR|nr:hypothetical protein D9615_009774 [Tricholomella constricta]KAF5382013.1 hypothetical protein D9615_004183 [Tricholomella constricta]
MSSSITFQNNKPYDPITLSIWDDKYAIQAPIVLEDATLVKDCLFIYKAKMKFVNDAAGQAAPETTIVKFSSGDPYQMMKMEKEANFYVDHLRTTYGNGVPTFYGLYKGNYSRKDRRGNLHTGKCACLVLQYCGEPLRIAMFKELENDRPFRQKLVELFERLHIQLGIWHRDLYPFDVLNNDGVPFIIDFSNASLHKCEISVAIVEGEVEPSPRLIPCPEFSAFLDALDTWWLPTVTVWHRGLYVTNNRVKSAAYIFERIRLDRYLREDGLTDEDFWNEAVVAWKTIRSHWAKYHPKDSTIPPLGITDYEEYLAKKDGRNDALAKAG